ncbi:MAG: universal stress protein [Planctomycetes bacterium]|nr:universal stress protein [Planctomycetota bacterium]
MTIICGTDFSEPAARAVTAAAHLARFLKQPLELVHVLDLHGAEAVLGTAGEARVKTFFEGERAQRLEQLQAEARRVAPISASTETSVVTGRADQALVQHATNTKAEVIVVAAVGARGDTLWRLGSTADRVAQSARTPVIVVRDESPIRVWTSGERPMRVAVGVDFTPTSDAALKWAASLTAHGPIELIAIHVFVPPAVRERTLDGEAERLLAERLKARMAEHAGGQKVELNLVSGLGRPADHIEQVLKSERADLLVVGTHQRTGVGRLWTGSVSHDAIVRTSTNVAVVPTV